MGSTPATNGSARGSPYKESITVMRTCKFSLKPTKEPIEKTEWTPGMCRRLYNVMLEQRISPPKDEVLR